jgi:hypothetical protein
MSKEKQTAVEWLIDIHFGGIEHVTPYFKKHIEQAKQMEKEQIKSAFEIGSDCIYDLNLPTSAEQYYNENYGVNK